MQKKAAVPLVEGVYAALATPRRQGIAEIDSAAFLDYLDTVVSLGVDGLVLFGSTGEFIHFDIEDRSRAFSLCIRRSRVPVLVNVSHSTFDGAVALAENAVDSGAAGILLMPPYFYRYTDEQLLYFYLQFTDTFGGRVPVYLYNLPSFTNPISAVLAGQLLESGRFAGIKDSSGDWSLFETLSGYREMRNFRLVVGNENIYLRGRMEGADGVVSGVAAAIPELIVSLDRCIRNKSLERAILLNEHLQEFLTWISRFPSSIGIKQAAVARGWKLDHSAIPLPPVDEERLSDYRNWLKDWIPTMLRRCADA